MLVLSRRNGEKVLIPRHGLEIQVLEVRGNKVRLGFVAPPGTDIFREEVWLRKQQFAPEGGTPDHQGQEVPSAGHCQG